jgi:hypothetical protein
MDGRPHFPIEVVRKSCATSWASSSGRGAPASAALRRASSSSPSHLVITTAAIPLPIMFTSARTSLMKRSTPNERYAATGMVGTTDSVPTSAMKEAPVTPEAPFEVSIATPKMASCWVSESSVFVVPRGYVFNTDGTSIYTLCRAVRGAGPRGHEWISNEAILPPSSLKTNLRSIGLPGKFPVSRLVTMVSPFF